ncbi:unnamed protein product, partial [Ixodes persulcatus]
GRRGGGRKQKQRGGRLSSNNLLIPHCRSVFITIANAPQAVNAQRERGIPAFAYITACGAASVRAFRSFLTSVPPQQRLEAQRGSSCVSRCRAGGSGLGRPGSGSSRWRPEQRLPRTLRLTADGEGIGKVPSSVRGPSSTPRGRRRYRSSCGLLVPVLRLQIPTCRRRLWKAVNRKAPVELFR